MDDLVKGNIKLDDINNTLNYVLSKSLINLYFNDHDINYFNALEFDNKIEKYKSLIQDYTNHVIELVSAKASKNLNHNSINYASSSPIGRLKKAISSGGRGVSIRDTLLNYNDIIKAYFPCFLMSPLSAAQYLSVDNEFSSNKFDIVIFDEASQIPTHEAVGPIARGKSLIVAGDPKQMPPSNYFQAAIDINNEDIMYEDAVSLLDECLAINLERIRLKYHYRSRHISLIGFSNKHFYNDGLYTFPQSNTSSSMVTFKYVKLLEEKKNSNMSKEEIKAILDTVKEIYTDPKTKDKSLGIIVFNMNQQEVLEDKLNDFIYKDKELQAQINKVVEKTGEDLFIKSLENVQGDERDIIILSVGFRKGATGHPTITGAITRTNGERRINVAASRSKEKMIIISTIKHTDFSSVSESKGMGPVILKELLKYAEENTYNVSNKLNDNDKAISKFIKHDLEKLGYNVDLNVGSGEYRVDIAIKSKDGIDYVLGILLDQNKISNDVSIRDKMYLQKNVLQGLKWNIINVYTIEYFKDPINTINKIINSIKAPIETDVIEIKPDIQKAPVVEFKYNEEDYRVYNDKAQIYYTNQIGFHPDTINILRNIIKVEAPVSFERIKEIVKDNSNITTISNKCRNILEDILNKYFTYTNDQTQNMYWDTIYNIEKYRVGLKRDIYDIPKEEILCCMRQILSIQGNISKEDLFKMTLQQFRIGSAVLNNKNLERLNYVYDLL